ncbi:MAG TPA: biotin/lipoyl-binding protein, partial [Blastocatellia bacterium]
MGEERPQTMDAGLKSLRIDRSAKQATKSARKTWRWVLFVVVLLAALSGGWMVYARLNAATEVETVRVRSASSSAPGDTTILNATGYIIAAHKIALASKVSGRVAWIGVEKGDRVKQGQVLVRLEDEEFRARVMEA